MRMTARREQQLSLVPLDNRALANLCGPLDTNLRQIEAALDVTIAHRGGTFTLAGTPAQTARAAQATARYVLPVPAGPMPNVMSCSWMSCR